MLFLLLLLQMLLLACCRWLRYVRCFLATTTTQLYMCFQRFSHSRRTSFVVGFFLGTTYIRRKNNGMFLLLDDVIILGGCTSFVRRRDIHCSTTTVTTTTTTTNMCTITTIPRGHDMFLLVVHLFPLRSVQQAC
mmetsp:Transcript_33600/g.37739  ORF Transcript_33600/g.37739 Transcript_33600/m.37739 type:complete len:134 (-) Transcript_33600:143-544(-)